MMLKERELPLIIGEQLACNFYEMTSAILNMRNWQCTLLNRHQILLKTRMPDIIFSMHIGSVTSLNDGMTFDLANLMWQ